MNVSYKDVPYGDLFIYYLQGRPDHGTMVELSNFIGNWEEDGFSFLFFSEPSDSIVEGLVESGEKLCLLDKFEMTYDEWLGEKPGPLTVGNFLITPPWQNDAERGDSKHKIFLDPGVVFGTGTHPTTRDCLEAMEILCYEEKIESVLDLGTGTGLLALAACVLGCGRALAVDFNLLAARTAKRNVQLNNLENSIMVIRGRAEEFIDRPADLVISNIHYEVMKEMVGFLGHGRHRFFILSGLLRSQARDMARRLADQPVEIMKTWEMDGIWHTFLGKML